MNGALSKGRAKVPPARAGRLDSTDRRYEPFVRLVPAPVRRVASSWRWDAPDGGGSWDLHIEHVGAPTASVRMLLVHGAGGNAAAMWPYAAHLSRLGARVTVVDLPGYGRTIRVRRGRRSVSYGDWQQLLVDLVGREHDERPLVLVGASMGGALAVDTAAVTGLAKRVIATCLLDPTRPGIAAAIVRAPWIARLGLPLLQFARGPAANPRIPVRVLTPMSAISNDPGLSHAVLTDPCGGGGAMPVGWYRSFLEAGPAIPPEQYQGPPVVLLHPAEDRWTMPELSLDYLGRLHGKTRVVMLPGCGHFPLEEPGFQVLLDEVSDEMEQVLDDQRRGS